MIKVSNSKGVQKQVAKGKPVKQVIVANHYPMKKSEMVKSKKKC